jgi:cyclopropane-fatty-acyl-phospholipid synthase
MAERDELEFSYSLIDRIFRLSLGELADFSGAKYDGDFSLSLEQAQRRKHEYVAEQVGIGPGRRLLDLGCGWGPLLAFARSRGGTGVGVTLSSAQAAACRRHGLDVHLQDAREVTRDSFGPFDAVASLGAFEHFCSRE